jgi:glycine/D-amino acid oxidase-like deaminating enzyme
MFHASAHPFSQASRLSSSSNATADQGGEGRELDILRAACLSEYVKSQLHPERIVMDSSARLRWGQTPWTIDFHPDPCPLPEEVDLAVVGGGFTGLAAAAWLRRLDPQKKVAVFEAEHIGAGSSGHTGGLALAETAAGALAGLGDVLGGFSSVLRELDIAAELSLPGVWELSRRGSPNSPISWSDSGTLSVAQEVSGGTIDPGKLIGGLGRAAAQRGALILERARVESMSFEDPIVIAISGQQVRARHVLVATNAQSLELGNLVGQAEPKFTLALATEPLTKAQLETLGLASGKPFYTVDLPYLWGRLFDGNRAIFGSGLVHLSDWHELLTLDVAMGEAAELLARLGRRVRALHPALKDVRFSHQWGGPILIAEEWRPVFRHHPQSPRVTVLGAYSGHGVALSVYLGCWAAETVLGRRNLPTWGSE